MPLRDCKPDNEIFLKKTVFPADRFSADRTCKLTEIMI